ncbi:MAG: HigA family addiction module antitoxin [Bacillota bacterium]
MVEQKKYFADVAVPPGDTLKELLEVNNMTQAELANRIDMSNKHINQIIKGKTSLTPETALKLEKIFDPPASFWLNLEANFQAAEARLKDKGKKSEQNIAKKIPYSEMEKLSWVEKTDSLRQKIDNLRNFFRVSNLNAIGTVYEAAYRTSKPDKINPLALAAWLERGEFLARDIEVNNFSKEKLKSYIPHLREMTTQEPSEFYNKIKDKLAECGIAFVIVPYLSGTYAQGSVKWLAPNKVMLQMSLRYKYADIFWFSFFHEIGHIMLHSKKETYIEFDLEDREDIEEEADKFAAKVLIPKKEYNYFIEKGNFSRRAIKEFASSLKIDPGIVVGRLQFEGKIGYDKLNGLKTKYNLALFTE